MAVAEPTRRLSPRARDAWALQQVGLWAAVTIAGLIVGASVDGAAPWSWVVPLLVMIVAALSVPTLRYRRWRWDIGDVGLDIRHGTFTVRRTLVPWVRVQHVDTRRGIVEQGLDLATVIVHTAAGSHTVPMLPQREADELRNRIAGMARVDD